MLKINCVIMNKELLWKDWLNWKVIKVYNEILIINHIVKNKRIYEFCDPNYNYFLSCGKLKVKS